MNKKVMTKEKILGGTQKEERLIKKIGLTNETLSGVKHL
jgi:hypothetical protein